MEIDQIAKRISGLENICELPKLFFTLSDGNPRGVCFINELRRSYLEDLSRKPSPPDEKKRSCEIFHSPEELSGYLKEHTIAREVAVVIFDDPHESGRFSSLCHNEKSHQKRFPNWASALWGIALHPRASDDRIKSIVHQVKSDFGVHFLERIDQGKLPSGERPAVKKIKGSVGFLANRRRIRFGHEVWP